jgi:hypothetical protein
VIDFPREAKLVRRQQKLVKQKVDDARIEPILGARMALEEELSQC